MKILLTGGAGYIGSACLRWLLKNGHDPIAFDNMAEGNAAAVPEGRLVVGDICDTGLLTRTLKDHGSEAVMHFAALASVPLSIADPESYWRPTWSGPRASSTRCGPRGLEDRLQQHGGDLRLRRRDADPRDHAAGPRDPLRHDQARPPSG